MTVDTAAARPGAAPLSPETERVQRFTRTERWAHWMQAVSFIVLLLTGFGLMLPIVESIVGHRDLLREIHLTGAFFLFFGPALVALSADRASFARDVRAVDTWDRDDFLWLLPRWLLQMLRRPVPPQGRFNAGQKLNAIFVVWSTIMFTVTGLLLWQNRRFPSDLVGQANTIHTALAYIALLAFLGHVYLAAFNRATNHSLRAITLGWVNRAWAEHHHSRWVQGLRRPTPPPPHDAVRTAVQIVLGAAAALFATRLLFVWIGANTTDRVTERLYALTAWPGEGVVHVHTGARIFDLPAFVYLVLLIALWIAVDGLRRVPARRLNGE